MNKIVLFIFCILTIGFSNGFAKEKSKDGVTFSINQINSPAVNAFFLARGFSMEQIKPYSDTCVYTTILRNDNKEDNIHYLRKNWFAKKNTISYSVKTNDYWLKATKANPSSWIAFRLSQMPEEQIYEAKGDWNQGMLSIDLLLGNTFDITIVWDTNGKPHELTIEGINCAK